MVHLDIQPFKLLPTEPENESGEDVMPSKKGMCLLRCSELPLRHVFQELDGTTSSPDSFSGPVGKSLKGPLLWTF